MRIGHLLLALTLGLSGVSAVHAQSAAGSDGQMPKPETSRTPNFQLFDKATDGSAIDRYRLPVSPESGMTLAYVMNFPMNAEPVCLMMRTYRMTRVERNSDVVEPGRYTICETDTRYSVKSAEQREVIPAK
jgi:hypothetical protein